MTIYGNNILFIQVISIIYPTVTFMPTKEWCDLARKEYEHDMSINHVFINWLASNKQGLVPEDKKQSIAKYLRTKSELFLTSDNDDSSYDWLRAASNELEKFEGIDVRISGPIIYGDFNDKIFANVSRLYVESEGIIAGNIDEVENTHRSELPDRSHDYFNENQLKWLVPASELLSAISSSENKDLVPEAARLLGLNNSSFQCVIHFYRLKNKDCLHRPTIFSECDEVRWACIENTNSGFGTTLDAVEGKKRLPEAVTQRVNLEKLNPFLGIPELEQNDCFKRLKMIGFKGYVTETENPLLDGTCSFASSFRKEAAFNIYDSNGGFIVCSGYCVNE